MVRAISIRPTSPAATSAPIARSVALALSQARVLVKMLDCIRRVMKPGRGGCKGAQAKGFLRGFLGFFLR